MARPVMPAGFFCAFWSLGKVGTVMDKSSRLKFETEVERQVQTEACKGQQSNDKPAGHKTKKLNGASEAGFSVETDTRDGPPDLREPVVMLRKRPRRVG